MMLVSLELREPTSLSCVLQVEFPPDLCSRVTFVNFTVTRSSLQSQCLNEVLKAERPDVDEKRSDLLKLQGVLLVLSFRQGGVGRGGWQTEFRKARATLLLLLGGTNVLSQGSSSSVYGSSKSLCSKL